MDIQALFRRLGFVFLLWLLGTALLWKFLGGYWAELFDGTLMMALVIWFCVARREANRFCFQVRRPHYPQGGLQSSVGGGLRTRCPGANLVRAPSEKACASHHRVEGG